MQQTPPEHQDDLPLSEQGGWKNGYIKEQLAKKHWTEMGLGWWLQIAALAVVLYFAGKFSGKY